jgi:hypothetical protein
VTHVGTKRKSGRREPGGHGNYISEWYTHRMYPTIRGSSASIAEQQEHLCSMLSAATGETRTCIKPERAQGVCTISSSNGTRQDWLVCPFRALDMGLMEDATRRLFGVGAARPVILAAAPEITRPEIRGPFIENISRGGFSALFLQAKLGGEISLSATARSPEMSFDFTLVEIGPSKEAFEIGRYGILEVQTMDFHGSYQYAVRDLTDALRLHGPKFPQEVEAHQDWLGNKIEGPNIANVFKRTFYQMMFKFQVGSHPHCAGCIFAVPEAVWDRWQRHLSCPTLRDRGDGTFALEAPGRRITKDSPTWIYVFGLDGNSRRSPSPVKLIRRIATDADALAHFAIKVAPSVAVETGGSVDAINVTIRRRLAIWWPELARPKMRHPAIHQADD